LDLACEDSCLAPLAGTLLAAWGVALRQCGVKRGWKVGREMRQFFVEKLTFNFNNLNCGCAVSGLTQAIRSAKVRQS
jgi:hypothetical protein